MVEIRMNDNNSGVRKVQMTLEGEKSQEDWTFAKANTAYLTHKLHDYPARMIPQIAERLIERYSPVRGMILDPFCGSGTTLVEARLAERNAVGNDVNPLAVLLAKVKSTPIDFIGAGFDPSEFASGLRKEHLRLKKSGALPDPPLHILSNLLHWFREPVARDLEFLYQRIMCVEDQNVRDFLKIVFSDTVFKTSNIDHRSSRFIRTLHRDELKRFRPNVLECFERRLFDSVARMIRYSRRLKECCADHNVMVTVREGDARNLPFSEDEFDAAITSPPYGEEKNTIGYSRWSKLSIVWLRLNSNALKESEKMTLGAIDAKHALDQLNRLQSQTARKVLKEIAKKDPARIADALPFFFDYLETMKELHRVLKPESFYCIVIGDRSIRKRTLDMERITVELGETAGFRHAESFFREIPMKLIPWSTPTGKTISRESIIILQKKGG
jgi:tRNA G10  N-methylase Trm11